MSFELNDFHRNVPEEELLSDLRRVAYEAGDQRVTFRRYNEQGKYSGDTIIRRFAGWLKALERAGLQKTTNRNVSTDELFENIVRVWTKIGRQPKFRDLTGDISDYGAATYASRFGGWRNALVEFVKWANEREQSSEHSESYDRKVRKTSRNINWRLRALVLMRDQARCCLCGASPGTGAILHVDHVKPWSKGGETTLENLQILCDRCNIGKGDVLS